MQGEVTAVAYYESIEIERSEAYKQCAGQQAREHGYTPRIEFVASEHDVMEGASCTETCSETFVGPAGEKAECKP